MNTKAIRILTLKHVYIHCFISLWLGTTGKFALRTVPRLRSPSSVSLLSLSFATLPAHLGQLQLQYHLVLPDKRLFHTILGQRFRAQCVDVPPATSYPRKLPHPRQAVGRRPLRALHCTLDSLALWIHLHANAPCSSCAKCVTELRFSLFSPTQDGFQVTEELALHSHRQTMRHLNVTFSHSPIPN